MIIKDLKKFDNKFKIKFKLLNFWREIPFDSPFQMENSSGTNTI